VGELLVALLGVVLMLSMATGAVVYRKHLVPVLLFRQKINWKNTRSAASGLHRVVGVWALLFNFAVAGSGVWMLRAAFLPATYQAEPVVKLLAQPAVAVAKCSQQPTCARPTCPSARSWWPLRCILDSLAGCWPK
jgi:uncharacterized iron-regulated membrane protein